MADPVEAVRRAVPQLSARRSAPLHARRMQAFLEHRPQDAFGRHRYDPADFGWTYAGLAAEFKDYVERYRIGTAALPRAGRRLASSAPVPLSAGPCREFRHAGLLVCPANRNLFYGSQGVSGAQDRPVRSSQTGGWP